MALLQARVATDAQRPAFVERARTTLSQTTGVQTADGSVIVLDDSRVARRLATTTAAIDASVADVDQLIAIADRAASPPFNVTQANAKLRDFAVAEETRSGSNDLFSAIGALLGSWKLLWAMARNCFHNPRPAAAQRPRDGGLTHVVVPGQRRGQCSPAHPPVGRPAGTGEGDGGPSACPRSRAAHVNHFAHIVYFMHNEDGERAHTTRTV